MNGGVRTRLAHRVAPVLALTLVNVFAVTGQAQWAYMNLGQNWLVAAGFAATLESIALFLSAEAARAMLANDRSGTLRAGAYAVGALVGTLNYVAHAGPDWQPTAMAIAFGALSMLSPWLWMIHTRGVHRAALRERELIDPRAVKLPLVLWAMYPLRAYRMFRLAVWNGENRPAAVRALYAERAALAKLTPVDALRYAFGQLGHHDPHAARVWLQARGRLVDHAAISAVSAGRPPAPTPPATPTPALAPVSGPPAIAPVGDVHAAQLAACASNRDRVRLAFSVLGRYDVPAALRWLAERGVTVNRGEAYAVARQATGSGPSGAFPAVPVSPAPAGVRVNGKRTAELATAEAR